jgi:hypothetical protein
MNTTVTVAKNVVRLTRMLLFRERALDEGPDLIVEVIVSVGVVDGIPLGRALGVADGLKLG